MAEQKGITCAWKSASVLHLPFSWDGTATLPSAISLHRVQRPWRKTPGVLYALKPIPGYYQDGPHSTSPDLGNFLPAFHGVRGQVLGYQEGLGPFLDRYRGISQILTQCLDHSVVATKLDTCPNRPWPSKAHIRTYMYMSRSTSYIAHWLSLTWAGVYTRSVCWQRNILVGTHHANSWRDMIS